MFIHFPYSYEIDAPSPKVAEIIIAKHNFGPVGSVELIFRESLARFENAATRVFKPKQD
jgi:replicative DNA helicase